MLTEFKQKAARTISLISLTRQLTARGAASAFAPPERRDYGVTGRPPSHRQSTDCMAEGERLSRAVPRGFARGGVCRAAAFYAAVVLVGVLWPVEAQAALLEDGPDDTQNTEVSTSNPYGQTFKHNGGSGSYSVTNISLKVQRNYDPGAETFSLYLESSWGANDIWSTNLPISSLTKSTYVWKISGCTSNRAGRDLRIRSL